MTSTIKTQASPADGRLQTTKLVASVARGARDVDKPEGI